MIQMPAEQGLLEEALKMFEEMTPRWLLWLLLYRNDGGTKITKIYAPEQLVDSRLDSR
jgi:hypothetical protein